MDLSKFFDIISTCPTRWKTNGTTIRSFDASFPNERHTPLLVACIYVSEYRGHNVAKFGEFYEQGRFLNLSERDTHALFRTSDNKIIQMPAWEDLTEKEQQFLQIRNQDEYQFWRLRNERDYNIQQMLLASCKLK